MTALSLLTRPLSLPVRRLAWGLLLLLLALMPCLTLTPPSLAQSGPTVADAGFEAPSVGPAGTFTSYQYGPAGAPWTFTYGGGFAANGSGFTYANPAAPDGAQVAFLHGPGSISQAISGFQAGTGYQVSFSAAQRGQGNTAVQDFQVYLDTTRLGTFTPGGASYTPLTTNAVVPGAGTHTLKFVGLNSAGGDNTALLDNIQLQTVAFVPPTNLSATAGDTQVLLSWTASAGAVNYNLYRGTASGGETLLKSGLTGTSYTDPSPMSGGTVFYYQASAVGADGTESARSGEAIPPVRTGHWLHCDDSGKLIGDEGWPVYATAFPLGDGDLTGSADHDGYPDPLPAYVGTYNGSWFTPGLTSWLYTGAQPTQRGYIGVDCMANGQTPTFPDSYPAVQGTSHAKVSGTLKAFFKWVSDPAVAGQSSAPAPNHMDVLLSTYAGAKASVGYSVWDSSFVGLTPDGSAWARTNIPQFNETAYASTGGQSGGTGAFYTSVQGRHLLQASVNGGIAAVTLSGSAEVQADSGSSDGVQSQYGSPHMIYGAASTSINVTAQKDKREVTIGSDIETSYQKGPIDPVTHTPPVNARNADGSITVDSAVTWDYDSTVEPEYRNPHWWAAPGLQAAATNFQAPNYSWSLDGDGTIGTENPDNKQPYLWFGDPSYATLQLKIPSSTGGQSLGKTDTVHVKVTDTDNATDENTYTINWHYPYENWAVYKTLPPVYQPQVLDHCDGDADTSQGPQLAYAIMNGSVTGHFRFVNSQDDTDEADTGDVGLALEDMFSVAANMLPNKIGEKEISPVWAGLLQSLGITAHTQLEQQEQPYPVNYNDAWIDEHSTGRPWPCGPITDDYKMRPTLMMEYQAKFSRGDAYGKHGYIGPATKGVYQWTGHMRGAGEFEPTNPNRPPRG